MGLDKGAAPGTVINTILSQTSATVGASSAQVVAANTGQSGSSFVNDGTVGIYLGLGQAAVVGQGIYLAPGGGSWDGRISGMTWIGAVYAIAVSGSSNNLCVVTV